MKTLQQHLCISGQAASGEIARVDQTISCAAPAALRGPVAVNVADQFGYVPGLLPRGGEVFDWRALGARMIVSADRESEIADGLADLTERACRRARADVWRAAAAAIREEAARKGLA